MVDVIKIETSMSDPTGKIIPVGVNAKLKVIVSDGVAVFSFNPVWLTKRFANIEIELRKDKGLPQTTSFHARTQKSITVYPGKTKEEIRKIIEEQLDSFKKNVK